MSGRSEKFDMLLCELHFASEKLRELIRVEQENTNLRAALIRVKESYRCLEDAIDEIVQAAANREAAARADRRGSNV